MTHKKLRDIIAIIDDEPNVRETVQFILQNEGFHVIKASNGTEGLAVVEKMHPKVVLLDLMMPDVDGYRVCAEIKKQAVFEAVYIIMLTAKGQDIDRKKALQTGADEYLTKPLDAEQLINIIRKKIKQTTTE